MRTPNESSAMLESGSFHQSNILVLEICQCQETPSENNIQAIIIELVHQELVQ